MTRSARRLRTALAALSLSAIVLAASPTSAWADDTIKQPGEHPHYGVEVEPHLLLGWGWGWGGGLGLGGRFSIPIVENGFVSSINNSVAISFGGDFLFYSGCYYRDANCNETALVLPVVLQWNFFVAQHWSVFGEPGIALVDAWWNGCGPGGCPPGGNSGLFPTPALYVGGRYHFSDSVALTMRIGFPSFSIGASFFL